MADLHEIMFALDANRAAQRLDKTPPAPDVPLWALYPLWRVLLGLGLLAVNVLGWWLILAK